jgi:hypothetical protein
MIKLQACWLVQKSLLLLLLFSLYALDFATAADTKTRDRRSTLGQYKDAALPKNGQSSLSNIKEDAAEWQRHSDLEAQASPLTNDDEKVVPSNSLTGSKNSSQFLNTKSRLWPRTSVGSSSDMDEDEDEDVARFPRRKHNLFIRVTNTNGSKLYHLEPLAPLLAISIVLLILFFYDTLTRQ